MPLEIEKIYNKKLPDAYINYLKDKMPYDEIDFNGKCWFMLEKDELLETCEMLQVGTAANYERLKLSVKILRDCGSVDTTSNVGKIDLERVAQGFVIGRDNGDDLYLDASDNFSVWIFYHDGGDVLRIADSFQEFIENAEK